MFSNIPTSNKIAFIDTDHDLSLSYKDLFDITNDKLNFPFNGKVVLLLCDRSLGTYVSYFSLMLKEAVVLLIDSESKIETIKSYIHLFKISYIFCNTKINLENNFESLKNISNIFDFSIYEVLSNHNHVDTKARILIPTSGSTGSSKIVALSEMNLISNATSIINYLKISTNDIAINNLPICYSYGLSILNTHLLSQGTFLVTKYSVFEKEFWDTFKKFKVSSFNAVPYIYEILVKLGFTNEKYECLRYMTQAGGKLNTDLQKLYADYANKNNIDFFVMYGQTEATARISYLDPEEANIKIGSIGKAIPDGCLQIYVNEKPTNTPYTIGELCYFGKNVFIGYIYNFDDLNKLSLDYGALLKTGDNGYFDEDGFFYITGRANRTVKIFGKRINLDEVEQIILKISDLKSLCIEKDNKIFIFFTDKDLPLTLRRDLSKYLNINISAINIKYLSKIPLNQNNKIDYKSLINQC